MNYIVLILIIGIVSFILVKTRENRELFSVLGCPLNRYILERTPIEYIFSGSFGSKYANQQNEDEIEGFVGQNSVPRQIWIYYPYDKNSRHWLDWGSRLYYEQHTKLFGECVRNLRKQTGWNVVVLNQLTLPQFVKIPAGLEENELYIQSVILYKYGGLWLPAYSFPIKKLDELREKVDNIIMPYIPDLNQQMPIMCVPGLKIWKQMSEYIMNNPNRLSDYSDFNHLYYLANCNQVKMVDGRVFGMLDKKGRMITFLNLVSDSITDVSDETYLVCVNKIEEKRFISQFVNYNAWMNQLIKNSN
jgi:hypothetical protein